MTIDMLPSGNFRIREMRNGKTYRIVVDHKPTKKEAKELIEKEVGGFTDKTTFRAAADNYINSKSNVLSPSTIRGYRAVLRNLDVSFLDTPLDKINLLKVQALINKISLSHTPKTVRNVNGFVMSVLKFYGSDIKSPTLPQKDKKPVYIPTEEEVKAILSAVKGTKYEVAFILGTMGLRRSEICALTKEDLDGNVLTINKALVQDTDNKWVIKKTKTTESTRTIVVPDYVVSLINKSGVCEYGPHAIYQALQRTQRRLGIQQFPFHKLRHFFASYMHDLGYSDKQIQEFGGWKTDQVMKTVYQHAMEMDKVKQNMSDNINNLVTN